jgi:hypothetical protein
MCCECGAVEELNTDCLCVDCEARHERAHREERAAEFRYQARYWLAVRPILQTPMADLVEQKFQAWLKEQEEAA